jgi:quaternary ammonium compound-resistance protein SugE
VYPVIPPPVGAFLVGIIVLGEAANLPRMMAAVFIVSSLLLMKLSSQT